jgi:hypothetical protein
MVVYVDLSKMPENQVDAFRSAGLTVKGAFTSAAMQQFAAHKRTEAEHQAQNSGPEDAHTILGKAENDILDMTLLNALWDTDYAVTVVSRPITFFFGNKKTGVQHEDIFNNMLSASAPDIAFKSTQLSPFDTDVFVARPSDAAYGVFNQAVSHFVQNGFHATTGWGGTYDEAKLALYGNKSNAFIEANPLGDHSECVNNSRWCFADAANDCGMLSHMTAAVDAQGQLILSSADTKDAMVPDALKRKHAVSATVTSGTEYLYKVASDHIKRPIPWAFATLSHMANETGLQGETHDQLLRFWGRYNNVWRNSWEGAPEPYNTQCAEQFACLYGEVVKMDVQLATAVDSTVPRAKGSGPEDRNLTMLNSCTNENNVLRVRGGPY